MPKTKPKPKSKKKSTAATNLKVVQGIVRGRVVYLKNGATLPDGQAVDVIPRKTTKAERANDPLFDIAHLAVDTGIPDLSVNLDHYLYGHPKVDLRD